jgi:hypothetical protein
LSRPPNYFDRYREYPNASYSQVRRALEEIGYSFLSDNGEIAYFKRNINDDNENALEIQTANKLSRLTITMIARTNNLDEEDRFRLVLLRIVTENKKA